MAKAPIYLRTRREALGLTQEELERRSGVSQNTISRLETTRPTRLFHQTVVQLATVLEVDPMRLRFGPDPAAGGRR